jgi:hypothetical protein
MDPGDFLDEKGRYLGNDGKNDGEVYVVKTSKKDFADGVPSHGISAKTAKATEQFIKANSGNTEAFEKNGQIYDNVQALECDPNVRQKMIDIVSPDTGAGGTADQNNREYGGTVAANDEVIPNKEPGPVSKPGNEAPINLLTRSNTRTEFHSHPSGSSDDIDRMSTGSSTKVGGGVTYSSYQTNGPSKYDIQQVGDRTGYIFSKSNNTVFIYNKDGVIATLPMPKFVNYK